MTPEQKETYKRTRQCPSCGSNQIATGNSNEEWELDDEPGDSSLLVSKSCQTCHTRWTEEFAYALVDIWIEDDEEEVTVEQASD